MRAAVATTAAEKAEEEGSRADTSHGYNGKHAWQHKEAAAHALYSCRLQVLPVLHAAPILALLRFFRHKPYISSGVSIFLCMCPHTIVYSY
jgi:hypothetical protein